MVFRSISGAAAALVLAFGAAGCAGGGDVVPVAEIRVHHGLAGSQLHEHFPVTVVFDDRMGTAEIARLAHPLEINGAEPLRDYQAGDVAYWPAEQGIVIFLHPGRGAAGGGGLLRVGALRSGFAEVAECVSACPIRLVTIGDVERSRS